jgi:hypothetical protein
VSERFDLIRLLLGSGVAGTAIYQVTKAFRTVWVERSRRKTTLAIMDRLIQRDRELGQPGLQLEVVRPPSDLLLRGHLQVEREPGDHRSLGAARG